MPANAALPRLRRLLLLLALGVLIAGAWWVQPATDPVIGRKPFSQWEMFSATLRVADEKIAPEDLSSITARDIRWLTGTVEHGRHPFTKQGPLPFDHAPDWLRQRFPDRWGGLRVSAERDDREIAMEILRLLGPRAAPAIPALVMRLDHIDGDEDHAWDQIETVVATLNAIGSAAWPAIQKAMTHPNPNVRSVTAEGLCRRMTSAGDTTPPLSDAELADCAKALANACHDSNADVRYQATQAIYYAASEVHDQAIIHHLESTIPDLAWLVRQRDGAGLAQQTLHWFRIVGAPVLPVFTAMLEEEDSMLYDFAAEELHQMGPSSWPVVERLLKEGKPGARCALVQTIGWRLDPEERDQPVPDDESARVCAVLIDAFRDPDPQMRSLAAEVIGWHTDPLKDGDVFVPAIPHLARLLADPDIPVRSAFAMRSDKPFDSSTHWAAIKALTKFGSRAATAVPILIGLLDNEQIKTRCNAAAVLSKVDIEEQRSTDHLRAMLNDPDADCRLAAEAALIAFDRSKAEGRDREAPPLPR